MSSYKALVPHCLRHGTNRTLQTWQPWHLCLNPYTSCLHDPLTSLHKKVHFDCNCVLFKASCDLVAIWTLATCCAVFFEDLFQFWMALQMIYEKGNWNFGYRWNDCVQYRTTMWSANDMQYIQNASCYLILKRMCGSLSFLCKKTSIFHSSRKKVCFCRGLNQGSKPLKRKLKFRAINVSWILHPYLSPSMHIGTCKHNFGCFFYDFFVSPCEILACPRKIWDPARTCWILAPIFCISHFSDSPWLWVKAVHIWYLRWFQATSSPWPINWGLSF